LPAPILTFGDEQAFAAGAAEHMIVKGTLGEALVVVEQDRLDQLRIHDEGDL
jgi:hypothetical protein